MESNKTMNYTDEELLRIAEHFAAVDGTTIASLPDTKPEPVIDGLVYKKGITLLAAHPKQGKTTLSTYAGMCVATGQDFLGHTTEQGSVLFMSCEGNAEAAVYEPYKRIRRGHELEEELPGFKVITVEDKPLFDESGFKVLRALCLIHRPKMLVIDSLVSNLTCNENVSTEVRNTALRPLMQLCKEFDMGCLLIHHRNKGGEHQDAINAARGASEFIAGTTAYLMLHDGILERVCCQYAPGGYELPINFDYSEADKLVISRRDSTPLQIDLLTETIVNILQGTEQMKASDLVSAVQEKFPAADRQRVYEALGKLGDRVTKPSRGWWALAA